MAKKDGTVDLRIQRTQKSIKQAFFELIEEEGFDHISVKDYRACNDKQKHILPALQ